MKYIKVTKLDVAENPKVASAQEKDWQHGEQHALSPFVGYVLEGFLLKDIGVGKSIVVDRRIRNGEKVSGIFKSTEVKSWDGMVATTQNSQYLVEEING